MREAISPGRGNVQFARHAQSPIARNAARERIVIGVIAGAGVGKVQRGHGVGGFVAGLGSGDQGVDAVPNCNDWGNRRVSVAKTVDPTGS